MEPIVYQDIKPHYLIDRSGNIFSTYGGKVLKLSYDTDKDGYSRVSLQCDSGRRSFRVNRLVAITYLPNPGKLPVVDHKNHDITDNSVDNLEWVTVGENTKRGYEHNNYHFVKGVVATDSEGRQLLFDSVKDCADHYCVSYFDISKIANGKISPHKKGKIGGINFEFVEKCID